MGFDLVILSIELVVTTYKYTIAVEKGIEYKDGAESNWKNVIFISCLNAGMFFELFIHGGPFISSLQINEA